MSGIGLARALGIGDKPVSRVENYCATGSEALRQAAYAVASGAYDVAMAVGVEKVKDAGYQGLNAFPIPHDGTNRTLTAAAMFSMVVPAYAERYGVDPDELRRSLAHIAAKNHFNGARNPQAQFRREITEEAVCAAPKVAGQLAVLDCAGVADGAAAAVVVRAEDAHRYTDTPLYVKAMSLVTGDGSGLADPDLRLHHLPRGRPARPRTPTPRPASPTRPAQLAMAEVHDCFTPTELVLMEDLGLSRPGHGVEGRPRPAASTSTASCPSTPTAASSPSATPSARRACGCCSRPGSSCGARRPRSAAISTLRRARPGPHPQPRRLPRRDGELRQHRRHPPRLTRSEPAADPVPFGTDPAAGSGWSGRVRSGL